MNQKNPNLLNDIPEIPELGWIKRLFRSRSLLTYWLDGKTHQVWICNFYEKNDTCIIYQDYATKQRTIIKSDRPIIYTITETK